MHLYYVKSVSIRIIWLFCVCNIYVFTYTGAVGWGSALQTGRSRVRFPMVSVDFFIGIILSHYGPNYFLGGKGGRCVRLTTLPPSCADCLEIWEPRPPGTLRACPGLYWDCFLFVYTYEKDKSFIGKCNMPKFETWIHKIATHSKFNITAYNACSTEGCDNGCKSVWMRKWYSFILTYRYWLNNRKTSYVFYTDIRNTAVCKSRRNTWNIQNFTNQPHTHFIMH
jgi:hypothetical protein